MPDDRRVVPLTFPDTNQRDGDSTDPGSAPAQRVGKAKDNVVILRSGLTSLPSLSEQDGVLVKFVCRRFCHVHQSVEPIDELKTEHDGTRHPLNGVRTIYYPQGFDFQGRQNQFGVIRQHAPGFDHANGILSARIMCSQTYGNQCTPPTSNEDPVSAHVNGGDTTLISSPHPHRRNRALGDVAAKETQ